MKTWKLLPKTEIVSKYVECYWFLEKELCDQGNTSPKLNPDPCAHLILASDGREHRYAIDTVSQRAKGSHWIYPHKKTFTMDHSSPFTIIGVKFKVGALYALRLEDLGSYLDTITPVCINRLPTLGSLNTDELLLNPSEQKGQVGHILDEALCSWMSTCHEDNHSALVRQILPLLNSTEIMGIGEKLHRSQRTIERSFLRVTGLSMKQVHSMNRLEEILSYLYQLNEADINWTDVAHRYDFSDQAHLIRHLKHTIGSTPAEYAQQRDLTIDIYGNFEFS